MCSMRVVFWKRKAASANWSVNTLRPIWQGSRTTPSIETSSLHLDLISDLKRINSHICSIAYPILDSAGELASNSPRLKKAA